MKSPNEDEVTIQRIEDPNCDLSVYIGRDVGYELIQLDETTEAISATNIRKKLYEESNPNPNPHPNPIIWLTGNSGAGKTTLAYGIRDHFKESAPVLVLDGDEMRSTISIDEGFSDEDRIKHNARVARLAKLMSEHGFLVIVAVIAPFDDARHMVSKICNPKWIYLKRSGLESEDRPYEPPTDPDLTVDNDVLSIDEARSTLISYLRGLEIGVRKPKSMPVKHKDSLIKR